MSNFLIALEADGVQNFLEGVHSVCVSTTAPAGCLWVTVAGSYQDGSMGVGIDHDQASRFIDELKRRGLAVYETLDAFEKARTERLLSGRRQPEDEAPATALQHHGPGGK